MPYYEFHFRDETGALLDSQCAPCAGDKQARILAHALRPAGTKQLEVWNGATLVYERPQTARAAAIEALRPQPMLEAAE